MVQSIFLTLSKSYLVNRRPVQFSASSNELGNFRASVTDQRRPSDHIPLAGVVHFSALADFTGFEVAEQDAI